MLRADTLQTLISFSAEDIEDLLKFNGIKNILCTDTKFLGITNAGQYCYQIVFEQDGESQFGKVFLTYDASTGNIKAEF